MKMAKIRVCRICSVKSFLRV